MLEMRGYWRGVLHFGQTMPTMLVLPGDVLGPKTVTVRIPQVPQLLAVGLSHEDVKGGSAAVVRKR